MKRNLLILACVALGVVFFSARSWGVCPEDANDLGQCDTFYTEVYPPDQLFEGSPPYFMRFPIYVTHDENTQPNGEPDSIAMFQIMLCYEHSNSSTYCSVSGYWNNTNVYPSPDIDRSVFRHFVEDGDTVVHNWMMDLSQRGMGLDWDTRVLDLDGISHFWFALFPSGSQDQRFGEGSRVLLATITFKVGDTTTVCLDSCFTPVGGGIWFARSDAVSYHPRHFLPVCELLGVGVLPQVHCPDDKEHHTNGQFSAAGFSARAFSKVIQSLDAEFEGNGIADVWLENVVGMGTDMVEGEVVYRVNDHCEPGGTVILGAVDDAGARAECDFNVTLLNTTPRLLLPDTVRALSRHVFGLDVGAQDSDEDEVTTILQTFWFVSDSIRSPSYYPFYLPGNPGHLSWETTDADTGLWMFSFVAVDDCGSIDTEQVAVSVGIPYCGDCNENGLIEPGDVIFLLNYLFRGGDAPQPLCRGDANCNGDRDPGDVVLLINYLFKGNVPPCFECCAGSF
jgi:hypothetical protein